MSRNFAENLVRFRAIKGLTQQQLGDLAGVSPSQISRYEAGDARPRRATMRNLAEALEVSVDDLNPDSGIGTHEVLLDLSDFAREQLEKLAEQKGISFEQAVQLALLQGMKMRLDEDPKSLAAFRKEQPGAYELIVKCIENDGAPEPRRIRKKK